MERFPDPAEERRATTGVAVSPSTLVATGSMMEAETGSLATSMK